MTRGSASRGAPLVRDFGLADLEPVIVEAVFLTADGRRTLRADVDPREQGAKPLVLQQP
jgi:hypothetical protein